jgi:hypothetical protein
MRRSLLTMRIPLRLNAADLIEKAKERRFL